jgi:hypothetical protein
MKWRWNRTMLNLCSIVAVILKMATGRNFSMSGHHIYPHIKFWWYRTMLNFCGIVTAILKMATGRKIFQCQESIQDIIIYPHKIFIISDNVEFLWPFWKWRPLEICQCRE